MKARGGLARIALWIPSRDSRRRFSAARRYRGARKRGDAVSEIMSWLPRHVWRSGVSYLLTSAFCLSPFAVSITAYPMQQKTENKNAVAAASFPAIVAAYIEDLYMRHPNIASASGLHAWEGRLEDYSSQGISDEISAIKKFQSRLEKVPPLELELSDIFDYQILAS